MLGAAAAEKAMPLAISTTKKKMYAPPHMYESMLNSESTYTYPHAPKRISSCGQLEGGNQVSTRGCDGATWRHVSCVQSWSPAGTCFTEESEAVVCAPARPMSSPMA